MHKLVLLRHGESVWNKENLFTGWTDVELSERGIEEARAAGELMAAERLTFDVAYTSLLRRAINTLHLALNAMDLVWLPVHKTWRLNERHYGALQGLNKAQTAQRHGEEQVHRWRRSYDVPPPVLERSDERHPSHDRRYASLPSAELPATECLKDTVERFLPVWHDPIAPEISAGRRVIIAAHGNSLRALVKYLDAIGDDDIAGLNVPTGVPLVYELNDDLTPIRHYYLGDAEAVAAKAAAVANQAKSG